MKIYKNFVITLFFSAFLVSCASCPPISHENAKKVYVEPVENNTIQYGLDTIVRSNIIEMISTSSYLSLADEEKDADVIVKVTIKRYFLEPLTYDMNNCPDRYRMHLIAGISLVDNANNSTVWTIPNIKGETVYRDKDRNPSGEDWIVDEKSEEEAKRTVCMIISGEVMSQTRKWARGR
jgi:hypothetical protein